MIRARVDRCDGLNVHQSESTSSLDEGDQCGNVTRSPEKAGVVDGDPGLSPSSITTASRATGLGISRNDQSGACAPRTSSGTT